MSYDHTQKAPLYLILLVAGAVLVLAGLTAPGGRPIVPLMNFVLAVWFVLGAFAFKSLRVRDEGDCLAIRFGPLPVFRRRIPYSQITGAEAGRSSFLDGWGVHWGPGRGWIYNLYGFDCVVVRLGKKTLRIGTDDMAGLVAFLNSKIGDGALRA
jgi:hypothetical protein